MELAIVFWLLFSCLCERMREWNCVCMRLCVLVLPRGFWSRALAVGGLPLSQLASFISMPFDGW